MEYLDLLISFSVENSAYFDVGAVILIWIISNIARTKASFISAVEFVAYSGFGFLSTIAIMKYELWGLIPYAYLGFTLICFFTTFAHLLHKSHRVIALLFFIPMVYNLVLFTEHLLVNHAEWEHSIVDKAYPVIMQLIVISQIVAVAVKGGLRDGTRDIVSRFDDPTSPYLRIAQGESR